MPLEGFNCIQCGLCCKLRGAYQNYATDDDYQRWQIEAKSDILQHVAVNDLGFDMRGDERQLFNVWVTPGTEDYLDGCPFLEKIPGHDKYRCAIHETKPWHCRSFPSEKEFALRIGCRGFDDANEEGNQAG